MKKIISILFIAFSLLSCEQGVINEQQKPNEEPLFTFDDGTELNQIIDYRGGTISFSFTTNCSWVIEIDDNWNSIDTSAGNAGSYTININVDENKTGEERISYIPVIYNGSQMHTISITQKENPIFNVYGYSQYKVDAEGDRIEVEVVSNIDYTIDIPSDAQQWIRVLDTRTVENNTLTFIISENTFEIEREAIIKFSSCCQHSGSFKVVQYAKGCCANNKIIYTTSDGKMISLAYFFGMGDCTMESHTFENGYGKIEFDRPVRVVSPWVFNGSNITTITLPSSITQIYPSAFSGCKNLNKFYSHLATEDGRCLIVNGVLLAFAPFGIQEYSIHPTVTSIANETFANYENLTNIIIPNSVKSIGYKTFANCYNLEYISIPNSVNSIDGSAFLGCRGTLFMDSNLVGSNYTAPESSNAQKHWLYGSDFSHIIIGPSVTHIGDYAFGTDKNINAHFNIGCNVEDIGCSAFYNCGGILEIDSRYIERSFRDYYSDDSYLYMKSSHWLYHSYFKTLTIGNNVKEVGAYAFCDLGSLKSVTLGDNIVYIGDYTFAKCYNLEEIFVGIKVKTIDSDAFVDSNKYIKFKIKDLSSWCGICCPDNTLNRHYRLYYNGQLLTNVEIPYGVNYVSSCAFSGWDQIESIMVPESVTKWDRGSFNFSGDNFVGFKGDTSSNSGNILILNGTVAGSVMYRGFECIIPDYVHTIGDDAFKYCYFTKLVIPNSVCTIGRSAFLNCDGFSGTTIPESVTQIGDNAFSMHTLGTIYFKSTVPPKIGYNIFNMSGPYPELNNIIYVPKESVEAYKTAARWSEYKDYIRGFDF